MSLQVKQAQEVDSVVVDLLLTLPILACVQERISVAIGHSEMIGNLDVVDNTGLAEQADVLERAGDPCLGDLVGFPAHNALPVEDDGTLGRRINAGDHVEDGRLAGAVGSNEADDLTMLELDVEVGNGTQATEELREMLNIEESHYALTSFL